MDPHGPVLAVSARTWQDFLSRVKAGHHDLP
jgi:hypothetical protein